MTRDSYNLHLHEKLMVLHCQITLNPAVAAIAIAEAVLMKIFAEQVPSLHRVYSQVLEAGRLLYLKAVHADICTDVRAVGHYLALFCADLHSI